MTPGTFIQQAPLSGPPLWERGQCPITGLPVRSRPEWRDIPLTGRSSVSFCLVGDAVLHTAPVGVAGSIGVPRLYEKRAQVLEEVGLTSQPYAELKCFDGIPLRHSRRGRQEYVRQLTAEYDRGYLQGYWGYGGPRVFGWILTTAKLVANRADAQVYYVNEYTTAIQEALALLGTLQPSSQTSQGLEDVQRGWTYRTDGFGVTFEVLDGGVVLERSWGRFRRRHVRPYFAVLEQLVEVADPRGDGTFVQINDATHLDRLDWRAAVAYFSAAAELHRRHPCHGIIVCNSVGPVQAVSKVAHRIFPFPFVVEPDLVAARARAQEFVRTPQRVPALISPVPTSLRRPSTGDVALEERIRELVAYAGTINWHVKGIGEPELRPDDPFAPVYQLLRVLKHDFDSVLADRDAMQDRVLRASKLSALGTLTAGVSHELNSPLTAVLGDATVILEQGESDVVMRSAERIQRCARRMRDVIDQLSVFSRSGVGGTSTELDVKFCVEQACAELTPLLGERGVKVGLDLAPEQMPIRCDRCHLKTVLHNVVINASQSYTGLDVRGPHSVVLRTRRAGEWVQIRCEDQGSGMPPEVADRAFDPFFTTRDVGEGTGLGLYICDRLVTDHGGRIALESEPGHGTTVVIEFPPLTNHT